MNETFMLSWFVSNELKVIPGIYKSESDATIAFMNMINYHTAECNEASEAINTISFYSKKNTSVFKDVRVGKDMVVDCKPVYRCEIKTKGVLYLIRRI